MGLKVYRCRDNVIIPAFQTNGSACFDIHLNLEDLEQVESYNDHNLMQPLSVEGGSLHIPPRFRVKVPTGMVFDIPFGYSVRIHPRSSIAYKKGLVLSNQEAVIDHDFVEEVQLLLYNWASTTVIIQHQERVAQGEMVQSYNGYVEEVGIRPLRRGSRVGGIGSTGNQ